MKHKRILSMLVLPLAFAAGCNDNEKQAFETAVGTFTSGFTTELKVTGVKETESTTSKYVDFDGTLQSRDTFSASFSNNACANGATESTVVEKVTTVTETRRFVGKQQAWFVSGIQDSINSGTNGAEALGVDISGGVENADIFLLEPHTLLDASYATYLTAAQTIGVEDFAMMLDDWIIEEIWLYFFEYSEQNLSTLTKTTITDTFGSDITSWVKTTLTNSNLASNSTSFRFTHNGYVWELPSVASVQNEVLSANGRQLLVPEDVQIGDTWVSPNNTFMIALTNEAVSVNGPDGTTKTVDALLVVERSTQNDPLQASNAVSQCVNFFQSANNDYPDADTTHADSVKLDAQFTGPCIGGGEVGNGGYTNVAWYWYYKGLVVKMTKSSTTVRVYGVGYAHQTTNTCTKITTLPVSAVPVTETSDYKPYVEFEVTTNMETFTATMIDDNASLLQDYLDQQAASESAGATTGN